MLLFFETVIMIAHVNILSMTSIVSVSVGVLLSLSLLPYNCCCWHPGFGALSSNASESCRCCCFVVVVISVPYCGCIRRLLRLVVGSVLLLSLSAQSPISSNIIFATGARLKQPVYVCIGQRFGWVIHFPLLS